MFDPLAWIDPLGLKSCPEVIYNEKGQLVAATATVSIDDLYTGTTTNKTTQKFARQLGRADDDAGHIQGSALGGAGDMIENIFPQLPKINRGAYRVFESKVIEEVIRHGSVDLKWEFIGGDRPTSIIYSVFHKGKLLMFKEFEN